MVWCRLGLAGPALTLTIHSQCFFCANASICKANYLFLLAWFPALSVLQGTPKGWRQHKDGQEHTAKCKQKPELQPGSGDCGKKTPQGQIWGTGEVLQSFYTARSLRSCQLKQPQHHLVCPRLYIPPPTLGQHRCSRSCTDKLSKERIPDPSNCFLTG